MSTIPFVYKVSSTVNFPMYPGAYMIFNNYGLYPIYGNINDFSQAGMNNDDSFFYVMPGFKLEVYSGVYTSSSSPSLTIDNLTGTTIKYKAVSNDREASACRLYFGNNLLTDASTTTTRNTTTTTTYEPPVIPQIPSALPIKYKEFPSFPGAYFLDDGSIPIFCCIKDFAILGSTNADNYWAIMPGFSLVTYYEINYAGTQCLYDNSIGTTIMFKPPNSDNQVSSCRLYYGTASVKTNAITVSGIS